MVTLRDILKSITTSVRNATSESEGQSTVDVIELYLDEQTSANIGDATSLAQVDPATIDKFSQELIAFYELTIGNSKPHTVATVVSCKAQVLHAQHYILLRSLRELLRLLRPQRIFEDWWHLLKPILSTASYTNKIKKETRLIISDALIMEQQMVRDHVETCVYFHRIVNMYLDWAESSYTRQEAERDETSRQHQALLDLEQDEWSRNLTIILLSVGASETKVKKKKIHLFYYMTAYQKYERLMIQLIQQFFNLLNGYFLSSQHRLQIVYLLSEFMRRRVKFYIST